MNVVGVRIALEWGHSVLDESLHTYQDVRVPADEIWGRDPIHSLHSDLLGRTPTDHLMRILNRRVSQTASSLLVQRMASLVRAGEYTVAEMAARSELSVRQFHRRCLRYFGLPPSKLMRINRLQQAAAHVQRHGNPGLADLAVCSGYFDQSHLNKETRELAGDQAGKALAATSNVRFVQYLR